MDIDRRCPICGGEVPPNNRKYCSRECYGKWQSENNTGTNNPAWIDDKIEFSCVVCGKKFYHTRKSASKCKRQFCSWDCKLIGMRGERAPSWSGGKIARQCGTCGKEFKVLQSVVDKGEGKFCSRKCFSKSVKTRRTITCDICGVEFEVPLSQPDRKYCSIECRTIMWSGENNPNWRGGPVTLICAWCGEDFEAQVSNQDRQYCSVECSNLARTGENSWVWQGGKSFEPYPPAFNNEFKRKIRKRDDYKCAICRLPARCVHHINYAKDDTNPENCITLCRYCHGVTNHNRDYWQHALFHLLSCRLNI